MDSNDFLKVYKSMIGGYREADDKHEGTHVLLSLEQFNQLISDHKREIEDFTRTNGELQRRLKQSESTAKTIADSERAFKAYAQNEIDKAKAREKAAKQQAGFEVEQMKRMLRDKANKERNLPRRAPGYYVIGTEEMRVYTFREEAPVYKSIISTPWAVELPLKQVKQYCKQEMYGGFFDDFELCCKNNWQEKMLIKEAQQKYMNEGKKACYSITYRAGKNYWEAVILHTGYVPHGAGGYNKQNQTA